MENNIYKINVSGKIYHIKYDILSKIPYFHEFLKLYEETCFVDRSSMIFDHVLAREIDPFYPYPSKYFYELDFYGLPYEKKIYKVNVLGKIYHLKREILMKIPYFVDIISKMNNSSVEIFVDRSPVLFEQILAYVMDQDSPIDCYAELKFYGIKFKWFNVGQTDTKFIKEKLDRLVDTDLYNITENIERINERLDTTNEKLDSINPNDKKGHKCEYECCDNLIDDNDELKYCDNHSKCRHCDRNAIRYNDYLCNYHQ
jgi:hypothetical protein